VIIGISTDKLSAQEKFTDKEKLNFPLFADADQKATKTYGVLMAGGRPFAQRVTFVIDKKGIVRKIYEVKDIDKHAPEVLEFVETLSKN
jgi:peroxiredoxin Q/BCP